MQKKKILVVEDDRHISELIQYNLERDGFSVVSAFDGTQALTLSQRQSFDLVVLDLMLPGADGYEVCRMLKQNDNTRPIPVIMLTAKSEEADVIVGLQMGADDYITKPFSPKVLIARVKAVLRRAKKEVPVKDEVRIFGDLVLDHVKHKVSYKKQEVKLTTIEFAILEFLSRSPGRVYTRDQILDNVWKEGKFIIDRAVDVHVRGLRKKLSQGAKWIETVRGLGYRFRECE